MRGALVIVLVVSVSVLVLTGQRVVSPEKVEEVLRLLDQAVSGSRAGFAVELSIFVAAYALAAVLVLPSVVFTIAGGFLFGAWLGTLVNLCASTAGAVACFLIARRYGLRFVPRSLGRDRRLLFVEQLLSSKGARGVAYLRLTPFVPFSALNYGFGLTRITVIQFAVGTFLGLAPKVWLGTVVGATGAGVVRGTDAAAAAVVVVEKNGRGATAAPLPPWTVC